MKTGLAGLFLLSVSAWPASLVSHTRDGNRVSLRLSEGTGEIQWLSPSTFRFRRSWSGIPAAPQQHGNPVSFAVEESAASLSLKTKDLVLTLRKTGLLVRVETAHGTPLMSDLSQAEKASGGISWERAAPSGVRYYGLGARAGPVNARGQRITAPKPFLISTAGYAENHLAPGTYIFDLAASRPDRYRIEIRGGDGVDYYFYYGPSPKDIYEEHLPTAGSFPGFTPDKSVVDAAFLQRLVNGSLSGMLAPTLDLARYDSGLWPARLSAYLSTYIEEAKDRGFPFLRALPFQFPRDQEAPKYGDEFMLGDELLAAPPCTSDGQRSVYLPLGRWTNLKTEEVFQGPRVIQLRAERDELPLFSRNGSILPLAESGSLFLHYFPKLGGEFFLYEADLGEYSQVHAAPASDWMRLEIESKKRREYEWVIHHVERPVKAVAGEAELAGVSDPARLKPGAWFYDRNKRNLHLRVRVAPDEDHIVNLQWQ